VKEIDGADAVGDDVDQVHADEPVVPDVEDFVAEIVRPFDEVFVILFLVDVSVFPSVLFGFPLVVAVVELDMAGGEGGGAEDDFGFSVLFDDPSLGAAGVEGFDIDAQAFALVAPLADRMEKVVAEAPPSPLDHRRGEIGARIADIFVVHPRIASRQIGAGVIQHAEIGAGGIEGVNGVFHGADSIENRVEFQKILEPPCCSTSPHRDTATTVIRFS